MKLMFLTVIVFLVGCHTVPPYDNATQALEGYGFSKENTFAQIQVGNVTKNVNKYIPELFQSLSHSVIVSERPLVPTCSLALEHGSSFPSQAVIIHVDKSGTGVIDYQREKSYFSSPDFSNICTTTFASSQIVVQ